MYVKPKEDPNHGEEVSGSEWLDRRVCWREVARVAMLGWIECGEQWRVSDGLDREVA